MNEAKFKLNPVIPCWCGECNGTAYEEPKWFTCERCGREAPYCYGASDEYYGLCDFCAVVQRIADNEFENVQNIQELGDKFNVK